MNKLLSSGIGLLFIAGICRADVDEMITHCAAMPSEDERITCLESTLRQLAPSEPNQNSAEPAPMAPPSSAPGPLSQPKAAGANGTTEALGTEQVEALNSSRNTEEGTVSATVVDFDFVGYRRLLVQLDNGQVWRQIDGDRVSVERGLRNEETFPVEMWRARLGGYRMRILPLDRIVRVERLK